MIRRVIRCSHIKDLCQKVNLHTIQVQQAFDHNSQGLHPTNKQLLIQQHRLKGLGFSLINLKLKILKVSDDFILHNFWNELQSLMHEILVVFKYATKLGVAHETNCNYLKLLLMRHKVSQGFHYHGNHVL